MSRKTLGQHQWDDGPRYSIDLDQLPQRERELVEQLPLGDVIELRGHTYLRASDGKLEPIDD